MAGPFVRSVASSSRCAANLICSVQCSERRDGSKFKAVNARDNNFTEAKMKRRFERIDESIARYMSQLETADRHGDAVPKVKVERLKGRIEKLKEGGRSSQHDQRGDDEEQGQADLADRS
jgi:hypothetical protein